MATTDVRLVKTTDCDASIRERVKFMRKKATTDERRPRYTMPCHDASARSGSPARVPEAAPPAKAAIPKTRVPVSIIAKVVSKGVNQRLVLREKML